MPCYINIEDRYNCRSLKARQQFNVFAATATALGASAAVAGAIGAGTTAAIGAGATLAASSMQSKAAGKAAAGQASAMKKARRQEKKAAQAYQMGAAQIESDLGQVPMPVFNLGQDIAGAGDISDFYRRQQELALGPNAALGRQEAYELGRQQLAELARMTAGEYSQADVQKLQRTAAESGIPINIQTAGKGMGVPQVGQAEFLRNLGMLPIQYKQLAFQYAPQVQNTMMGWVGAARNFLTQDVLDVSKTSLAYQMGGADVGLKKAGIRSGLLAAQFGVSTGQSQRGYDRMLELEKTGLARVQAGAEGFTGAAGGLTSGLTSALDAYTKYKTAQEGSTTATKEGFYTSQLGGASAYDTAPSNLKFYTGKGWSLG
jgi:hypothetical protein